VSSPGIGMSADVQDALPDAHGFREQPITQMLVKVASRCNIDCSYCYWFRDASVYNKPKLMSSEVLQQLLQRIEEHVVRHSLIDFPISCGGSRIFTGLPRLARASRREPVATSRSR
jgi:uncharacterized protein